MYDYVRVDSKPDAMFILKSFQIIHSYFIYTTTILQTVGYIDKNSGVFSPEFDSIFIKKEVIQ